MDSLGEGDEHILQEIHEDDDDLHAWCILEESEKEEWPEVICKQSRKKLNVENNPDANSKNITNVKDGWTNIRGTMDTGSYGPRHA